MNKISYIIIALIAISGMALSGCSKFLEFESYGPPTYENYWKTDDDVRAAVDGLSFWQAREGIDGRGLMWFENCSDNLVTGRSQSEGDQIKNFQMSADNGRDVRQNWPIMYQLIAKANDILANVPDMKITEGVKNNAVAQAHFYRAFAYLWLAPWYGDNGPNGGLQIVTEATAFEDLDAPRPASVLENYDMIISDLTKAADLLPLMSQQAKADWGRPHKAAAWAFAARAALYAAQFDAKYYQTVLDMTGKIMALSGSDKRELYSNYQNLFTESANYSSEYIFSIQGTAVEGPKFAGMSFQNGGWGHYNTWGYFQPTYELFSAYESGDVRRDATILFPNQHIEFYGQNIHFGVKPEAISSTSGMTFRKWMHPFRKKEDAGIYFSTNGNNQSTRMSIPLIRYADILLMRAETLIWTKGEGDEEAKRLINQVRERAGLPQNSSATKAQLMNERRCELAFEYQPSRHLDLVRWKTAQQEYAKPLHGVKTHLKSDGSFDRVEVVEIWPARTFNPGIHHVFPIPQADISKSKNLKQNQGY